jgi:DNA-binding response OmpR family regulator
MPLRRKNLDKRVLLVEDDPSVSFMVMEVLRYEGFTVVTASDGYRALELLRQGRFDAAILDVMLPGMDGISILRTIRSDESYASMPIVMVTAKTDDETTWAGWKAGCDYYLTKPFDPDELVAILERIESASTSTSRGR